jgi:hypothetical protein
VDVSGFAPFVGPSILAGLALLSWLALVARGAEKRRSIIELLREALRLRAGQESLQAAGRPAPFLDRSRRLERELRAFLARR